MNKMRDKISIIHCEVMRRTSDERAARDKANSTTERGWQLNSEPTRPVKNVQCTQVNDIRVNDDHEEHSDEDDEDPDTFSPRIRRVPPRRFKKSIKYICMYGCLEGIRLK